MEEWGAFMFGLDDRRVEQYEVLRRFEMPGVYKPTVTKYFRGYTANRNATPGMRIFVRFYKNAPDKIEVEIANDVGGREKIFQLTESDWRSVSGFCRWLELRADIQKRLREEKKNAALAAEIENKRLRDIDS